MNDDLKINLRVPTVAEPAAEIAPKVATRSNADAVREVIETEQPLPTVEQGSFDRLPESTDSTSVQNSLASDVEVADTSGRFGTQKTVRTVSATSESTNMRQLSPSHAEGSAPPSQNLQQERTGDIPCAQLGLLKASASSAASNVQPADAATSPSLRPSPTSGVTPPVHTRWKKGQSGNPGGRARHVSRAYIKHLEEVDPTTGETNADKIAKAQIAKAKSMMPDSTAAAREIRQATETDDEANKGGFNIGSLNVAILNQITSAATQGELE